MKNFQFLFNSMSPFSTKKVSGSETCDHDFHPEWFLPSPLLVQVCQFPNMVHFHLLFGSTHFAGVLHESFD